MRLLIFRDINVILLPSIFLFIWLSSYQISLRFSGLSIGRELIDGREGDRSEGKVGRRLVSFLGFGLTGYVKNVSQLMHCLVCKILLISLIIFCVA